MDELGAKSTTAGPGRRHNTSWSSPKGGHVSVDRPGQQVLERSSVVLYPAEPTDGEEVGIELRFCVSLPAQGKSERCESVVHSQLKSMCCCATPLSAGRTILGDAAYELFSKTIPTLATHLKYAAYDPQSIKAFIDSMEDQEDLRRQITSSSMHFPSLSQRPDLRQY